MTAEIHAVTGAFGYSGPYIAKGCWAPDDLLCVDSKPTGTTPLTTWVEQHRDSLGTRYTSELARRRR